MIKRIEKGKAEGSVYAPTSKSVAHRALILASMCPGESRISGITECADVLATIDCLRKFGVKIEYENQRAVVNGIDFTKADVSGVLDCNESGSTLRFLIPLAMLSGKEVKLTGSERLISRSQSVYEALARENGLTFINDGKEITVKGPLTAGEYYIDGNVSSQFITGLFLALSTLGGDSKIIVNRQIESRPYVDLTISAMREFKVRVHPDTNSSFYIFGGQEIKPQELTVEGDWSAAAFLDAFNLIGGIVTPLGLKDGSVQGDKVYRSLYPMIDKGYCEIDISDCPDLGPILFALAAVKYGARFVGTKRLRDKESDRAKAMQTELIKFGAELIIEENSVTVIKRELHSPTERLWGHNDHRIVMSLAVLCSMYGGEIEGCEATSKSYPDFFKHINTLGIKVYDIN